jgi:hypothetical protein
LLWPLVRAAYEWVKCVATILANAHALDGNAVKRQLRALLGAMVQHHHRSAPALAAMLAHCQKVTRSYWPGLFHCYDDSDVPRTNNDLEQFFGAHRSHERRATGCKGASPALVLRGAVRMVACAATRLRSFAGAELAPEHLHHWQTLRRQLESRCQQRVRRSRFRRHPEASLELLEKDLLQLILQPFVRQFSRIETCRLLLHTAPRVRYDDRGIFLAFLKSLREVDERCYGDVLFILALKIDLFHTAARLGLREPLTLPGLWGSRQGRSDRVLQRSPRISMRHTSAVHE